MLFSSIKVFKRLARGFDLSRWRGLFVVAAGGVAIFVATHYALDYALGSDAAPLLPRQRPLGWPLYERIWGRVSAVDRLYQRGQLPADTRLGIFMGVSTTATGIQRQHLDARATVADRWIVLTGAGLSFENLESVMPPVFFCSLKPAAVVLGVHPQMLVGEPFIGDEFKFVPLGAVGRRGRALETGSAWNTALGWLRKHWAIKHRALVAGCLRAGIYGVRLSVFYLAGVSAERLCPPLPEPWDDDPLWLWNMDDAEGRLAQDQVKFWSRRGHFKAANYDPEGAQAQSLVRMIRAYRALGAKVYIVIMPLHTSLRDYLVPPNAKPCLLETLRRAFPEAPPTVIDLEKAIPDPLFTDMAHLSKSGAERLSRMVAERLRKPAASSPAPDGP